MSNIWPIILVHWYRYRALSICRLSHHSQSPPHDSSQTPPCAPSQTHLARYMNAERGRFRGAFHCASSTFKAEGAAAFYKVFYFFANYEKNSLYHDLRIWWGIISLQKVKKKEFYQDLFYFQGFNASCLRLVSWNICLWLSFEQIKKASNAYYAKWFHCASWEEPFCLI